MRAAIVDRYGEPEVVRIAEVARPVVKAKEVLVRVVAVAVTSGDARVRGATFPPGFGLMSRLAFGLRKPRRPVLGMSFSGVVEEVGAQVQDVAPGDEVCGMTGVRMGAHAELVALAAKRVVAKPAEVTHEQAAGLLFGGSTAIQFLRTKVPVAPGMSVLVNGASGAVGSNAVQLAKHFGATVTAVTSGRNGALVRELGADEVVDHTHRSVVDLDDRFDVVFDAVGNIPVAAGRALLSPDGKLILVVAGLRESLKARGNVVAGPASERPEDFTFLLDLVAAGELTVVIDEIHDLPDIAAAYRRVDSGHKVGNVLVRP